MYRLEYYDGTCIIYAGENEEEVYYTVTPPVIPRYDSQTRLCEGCGTPIPEARVEALPNTTTCVNCSSVLPVHGDSRYGEISIARTEEEVRRSRLHYE